MSLAFLLSAAAASAVTALLFLLCCPGMLGILQQEGYSGGAFLRWLFRRHNMRLRRLELLSLSHVLLLTLCGLCFSFLAPEAVNAVCLLPLWGMCVLFAFSEKTYALKVPLARTPRMIRLIVCVFVLLYFAAFGAMVGLKAAALAAGVRLVECLCFVPLCLVPLLLPFLLAAANALMLVYEVPHNRAFIRAASERLGASDCVRVGITGSCGKTTVRAVAEHLLMRKFSVIATPQSYNTPLGIARTVKERGTSCEIFLAEMGARKRGDIGELCDMVRPKYGVITAIGTQHFQTFGSEEAIFAEKSVLCARTERCVLGGSAASAAREGDLVEGRDFGAEDVVCTAEGASFTLRLPDGSIPVRIPLLGRHAAQDAALAAALCSLFGMSKEEIAEGLACVSPVPHRLALMRENGLNILDDAYNANEAGARDAVETLRLFPGRKYVVTPGLVELGALEEEKNEALGAAFVGLDGVVLVGETLVLAVRTGYLAAGGEEARLHVVPTLAAAETLLGGLLSEGDSVLFLNDLPDKYL